MTSSENDHIKEALQATENDTSQAMPPGPMQDYLALTKPNLVLMLVMTTLVGFYLGTTGSINWLLLLHTLIGTSLAAGGTLALNQFMERDRDALMRRTRKRPLPAGRLSPNKALLFGVLITVGGLLYLTLIVNVLSGVVTSAIAVTYLFMYTPLKPLTSLSTMAGAIPGALPPVTGWVAARNDLGIEALVLFTIMFLWQLPHSLALAWLFREDYERGGFRLLPIIDRGGGMTSLQILIYCLALVAVSLVPSIIGLTGKIYFYVTFAAGIIFLLYAWQLARERSLPAARKCFLASLGYLIVQFATMALDKL